MTGPLFAFWAFFAVFSVFGLGVAALALFFPQDFRG